MPIQAFNSVTDGLDSDSRSRGHFIANLDTDDERLWVPYADGVWIQPCCFNVTSGGFSGGFAAYEDGFSLLDVCRSYYLKANLDVRQLELLIR